MPSRSPGTPASSPRWATGHGDWENEVSTTAAKLEALASTTVEDWHGLRSTAEEIELAIARVAAALDRPAVMG